MRIFRKLFFGKSPQKLSANFFYLQKILQTFLIFNKKVRKSCPQLVCPQKTCGLKKPQKFPSNLLIIFCLFMNLKLGRPPPATHIRLPFLISFCNLWNSAFRWPKTPLKLKGKFFGRSPQVLSATFFVRKKFADF